jgi:hypothetical protein
MDAGDRSRLISVKKGLPRHPVVVGAGGAALEESEKRLAAIVDLAEC